MHHQAEGFFEMAKNNNPLLQASQYHNTQAAHAGYTMNNDKLVVGGGSLLDPFQKQQICYNHGQRRERANKLCSNQPDDAFRR
jgi:hypothetical protein